MILFRDRAANILHEVLGTLDRDIKFLLPLNICNIVPETFKMVGIRFEFIDINPKTLCMDEDLALEAIKNDSDIGGILFVKTFGIKIESQVFYKKIKLLNSSIFIIDDQCLSIQNFDFTSLKARDKLPLYCFSKSK